MKKKTSGEKVKKIEKVKNEGKEWEEWTLHPDKVRLEWNDGGKSNISDR